MSLKRVEGGYSSIGWVNTTVNQNYGSLAKLNDMIVSYAQAD